MIRTCRCSEKTKCQ